MSKYYCILFEESLSRSFPGFQTTSHIYDFPIWGNYTIRKVLELSNVSSIPHSLFSVEERSDIEMLSEFLSRGTGADIFVVGRTGNVTVVDWEDFFRLRKAASGIGKVHLGKDPSELYILPRRRLRGIIADVGERAEGSNKSFCTLLFDEYLFHHFDRVINLEGYSFLMRTCYEYWRENLNLPSALQNDRFLGLYTQLQSPYTEKSSVSESGTMINSFVGCGSRVKGVVEDSIIFHDVHIGKNAHVRGSVILPFNSIEDGAVIENALLLEGRDRVIERNARVGGFNDVRNGEYPSLLQKGFSIIGHGVTLPRNSHIGAGCLVYGRGEKKLPSPFVMEDGTSYRAL